jgi:hypothetical protein
MSTRTVDNPKVHIAMKTPPIVSQKEWEAAGQKLLVKEKAFTRSRDALAAERRRMPWMLVEKKYEFERPKGRGAGDTAIAAAISTERFGYLKELVPVAGLMCRHEGKIIVERRLAKYSVRQKHCSKSKVITRSQSIAHRNSGLFESHPCCIGAQTSGPHSFSSFNPNATIEHTSQI